MTAELVSPDDTPGTPNASRRPAPPPGAGPVYGLGFIGALVWFWRQADGVEGHAWAVAKAMVWPAILVHDAFAALHRD